mmetsp:Transcript_22094/g.53009  ORF Transcript_22094/g.53009 Transcript_22094/m.53009 type:complete len:205 (-) Transcript_22094:368-982(-)
MGQDDPDLGPPDGPPPARPPAAAPAGVVPRADEGCPLRGGKRLQGASAGPRVGERACLPRGPLAGSEQAVPAGRTAVLGVRRRDCRRVAPNPSRAPRHPAAPSESRFSAAGRQNRGRTLPLGGARRGGEPSNTAHHRGPVPDASGARGPRAGGSAGVPAEAGLRLPPLEQEVLHAGQRSVGVFRGREAPPRTRPRGDEGRGGRG